MKRLLQTPIKGLLVLSAILLAALICCYTAIAWAKRTESRRVNYTQTSESSSVYVNEEELEQRLEAIERHESVSVSPIGYAIASSVARALPPSPLLKRQKLGSPDSAATWTFPPLVPIDNNWGHPNGITCPLPFPTPTGCGGSSRIDAIAVDPTDADIVYVGSEGGLSKSTDGGDTWSYISDDLASQSIRSLVIDPVAPNIIYAGTGTRTLFGKGIYRSVDYGQTWTLLGESEFTGKVVVKITVDPVTAGYGAICVPFCALETTLYASVISFVDNNNNSHSLWRSTDSGSTWMELRSAFGARPWGFYDIAIDPASPSMIYFTAPDGVFAFASDNFSRTLHKVHEIPNSTEPSYLAFAESELYLAYRDGNTVVTKSPAPGEVDWTDLSDPGGGLLCFGVNPAHPWQIFVGGQLMRYTLEGGIADSWQTAINVHDDMRSIAFCPTNSQRTYLGTDAGVYRADYEGPKIGTFITWYSKNENLPGALMRGVSISSDDSMVMGNQDNGTQLHDAATPNPPWVLLLGGDGYQPKIDPNNGNKLYYQGFSYGVNRVCNTAHPCCTPGDPWPALTKRENGVPTDITPTEACGELSGGFPGFFVDFRNAAHLLIGFQNVYRSNNSGTDWTRIGGGPNGVDPDNGRAFALYEAPNDSDVIYGVFDRRVFVTENANAGASATWTRIIDGYEGLEGISAITVDPTDSSTAYIASDTDIWKTTDVGTTWARCGSPDNLIYRDIVIDPDYPQHLFVASFAGVYASTNGGADWENMSDGIPAGLEVTSLSFNAASRHFAASTYGRGAYVMNLPPAIHITSPANNATVSGPITVSASASSNVVGVQFKLDGVNLNAEDTSAPFSINWDTTLLAAGNYELTAVARDGANLTTTSDPVTVTVLDILAPTVSITYPSDGAIVRGTLDLSATASDNTGVVGVQFKLDGNDLGDEDTSAPYEMPWNTTSVSTGGHTLTAVARDAAGHYAESVDVTVTVDNVAPNVAIVAPMNGAFVAGTVTVSALAGDVGSGVAGVQFKLDGVNLYAEDTSPPFSINWNTTLSTGTHVLTAVARDGAGNMTTSSAVTVTVDNVAPTVTITAPPSGTVSGKKTVSATASDNVGVVGVQFKLDGNNLNAEDTSSPFSTNWGTNGTPNGLHMLTAVARDAAGNTTTSAGVLVNVNN